jgi:hypothetical protein
LGSAAHADSDTNSGQNSELPVDLPKVVEDAMTVALGLQFRNLWVDRYCIPQDNHAVKTSQIEKMDEIYKSAEVTILLPQVAIHYTAYLVCAAGNVLGNRGPKILAVQFCGHFKTQPA